MRKTLIVGFGCVLLTACAANVVLRQAPNADKRFRVAVLPFKPYPGYPNSGELAYEAFSTYILEIEGYSVVDRGALEEIIKEQKLGQSGTIDQSKAVEIGKLLGAQGVVLGSVTEYVERNYLLFPPAKVSLTARMVNTETSEVEWTASKTVGGSTRWLTWFIWPVGLYATISSPSAEDQIQRASRSICRTVKKRIEEKRKR